jgi:flagellar biosynthesis/type III secretory pathway protein FliH
LDTDKLPQALDTPAVRRAMEVLTMMTQSELERDRYEARVKAERDRISILEEHQEELKQMQEALARGRQEAQEALTQGRQEGRQEGLEKGGVIGRILAFQEVLKVPLTPREQLHAMPIAELQALAEALAHQFLLGR